MILNVGLYGGSLAEKRKFSKVLSNCIDYHHTSFEIFRRMPNFEFGNDELLNLSINQLLFDLMLTNESVKGMAQMYQPLKLIVSRDLPIEFIDEVQDESLKKILETEIETILSRYSFNIVFSLDGEDIENKNIEAVLSINDPIEAARVINGICDNYGLKKYTRDGT